MRFSLFLLPFSFLCLLFGCTASSAQQANHQVQPALPLLHFQKTPCLGPCPAYNAMLYEDGRISYVGFKRGLAQDTLIFALTSQELQQLKQEIAALHYKKLHTSYLTQWSDIPSTYITFFEEGKEVKRVKHQEGGPQQLIQFQEWLHELVWQRAEEKSRPTQ